MSEDQPVNFDPIAESFATAMEHHDEVPGSASDEIIGTVKEACSNNEADLMWQDDYDEFMSILDRMFDGIYGNGYDEQIIELDNLREKLE